MGLDCELPDSSDFKLLVLDSAWSRNQEFLSVSLSFFFFFFPFDFSPFASPGLVSPFLLVKYLSSII